MQLTSQHVKHHFGHMLVGVGSLLAIVAVMLTSGLGGYASALGTSELHNLSNQQRTAGGLSAYGWSDKLAAAAQAKANHMVANNYFEHTAPDGTTGWYFITQQGYTYQTAGENLAASNQTSNDIVQGWMNSSAHRANLMSTTFTEVGYGIAFKGDYGGYNNVYYVVAMYAKPMSATSPSPVPSPAPTPPAAITAPKSTPSPPTPSTPAPTLSPTPQTTPTGNSAAPATAESVNDTAHEAVSLPVARTNLRPVIAYGAFGLSGLLIISGAIFEIRRFSGFHTTHLAHHI